VKGNTSSLVTLRLPDSFLEELKKRKLDNLKSNPEHKSLGLWLAAFLVKEAVRDKSGRMARGTHET